MVLLSDLLAACRERNHLLSRFGLASVWHGVSHVDLGCLIALQQQNERFEAAQPVALGSRHGCYHTRQQAVGQVLAVGHEEVRPVLTHVCDELVGLLLHSLVSLLRVHATL